MADFDKTVFAVGMIDLANEFADADCGDRASGDDASVCRTHKDAFR